MFVSIFLPEGLGDYEEYRGAKEDALGVCPRSESEKSGSVRDSGKSGSDSVSGSGSGRGREVADVTILGRSPTQPHIVRSPNEKGTDSDMTDSVVLERAAVSHEDSLFEPGHS